MSWAGTVMDATRRNRQNREMQAAKRNSFRRRTALNKYSYKGALVKFIDSNRTAEEIKAIKEKIKIKNRREFLNRIFYTIVTVMILAGLAVWLM